MPLPKIIGRLGDRYRTHRWSTLTAAGGALALAAGAALVVTMGIGSAATEPLVGVPVPRDDLAVLINAARACPALTPARLAGQVMHISGFEPKATSGRAAADNGAVGVARLTETAWQTWAPWKDAARTDNKASIVGLAHQVCDLVGQVRVSGVPGDPWQLALSAYAAGVPAVQQAQGVPEQARDYVDKVTGYADWYARQPEFGGPGETGLGGKAPMLTGPVAVPDAYVPAVVNAGKVCATITAPRLAAQLMAMSGFNPNRLGTTGAQGIAQFAPDLWARYTPSRSATPWDATAAIPTLGRAMCDLTGQFTDLAGDPYPLALAAFEWGGDAVRQSSGLPASVDLRTFIAQVQAYADYYAKDPRLAGGTTPSASASAGPSAGSGTSPKPSTTAPASTPTTPPKPGDGNLGHGIISYGQVRGPGNAGKCLDVRGHDGGFESPVQVFRCDGSNDQNWAWHNDGTLRSMDLCLDVRGYGKDNGNPVQLFTCTGTPNQIWVPQPNQSLRNPASGRCLDDPAGNFADSTVLQLWDCNGFAPQVWPLPRGGATGTIVGPGNAGKCVEMGQANTRGFVVRIGTCDQGDDQNWTLGTDGMLHAMDRCLDIVDGSTADGTAVQLSTCAGTPNQVWSPQPNGSLLNPASGRCLDTPNNRPADGVALQIWGCNNSDAQRWVLPGGR